MVQMAKLFIYFSLILFLTACATTSSSYLVVENDLEEWIDDELVPELSHALNNHPRLKHQPFIIVAMNNDDTLANIDGLSAHIRARLQEGLRASPGAKLMWQPGRLRRHHHRSLEKIKCDGALQQPVIQIGIDSQISALTGQLRVSIKAVDLQENRWITGFGYHWQANATRSQKLALSQKNFDEVLRGLRELPFDSGDADLLASYLAHNLSCVLREIRDDRISIYAPNPKNKPAFFVTAISLVDNYLDRFNEVEIADSEDTADFILQAETHDLKNGLYQIWAQIIRHSNDTHIGGATTQTYVNLNSNITAFENTTVNSVNVLKSAVVEPPMALTEDKLQDVDLQLITPPYQSLCQTANPWLQGAKTLSNKDQLPNYGCFAIEFTPYNADNLLVLLHDSYGQLHRLVPNKCSVAGLSQLNWQNDISTRIPSANGVTGVFDFKRGSGTESVYVLSSDSTQVNAYLNELITTVPEFCETDEPYIVNKLEFQQQLKQRSRQNNVSWTVAMANHE